MRRAADGELNETVVRRRVRRAVASYARYWLESLRLQVADPASVDARFTIDGLSHIDTALAAGRGAILAIPHLGGWDVGGSWLVRQGYRLTVVVEAVEPPELFEWFADLRRSWGMSVIPLDGEVTARVVRALKANEVVALLCDRDIGGGGVEVEFFGERTTLPGGPATLALRTGAPLLPTAIYFAGRGHHAVVCPPLDTARRGRLRDDVGALTQEMAHSLEQLIRAAPEQWHLLQPNWPSDRAVNS